LKYDKYDIIEYPAEYYVGLPMFIFSQKVGCGRKKEAKLLSGQPAAHFRNGRKSTT